MLSSENHIFRRLKHRIYQHFYKGYLRHYYESAMRPRPIRFILFVIVGQALVFTLAVAGTLAIISGGFPTWGPVTAYAFTAFMYLIGFLSIPTLILLIQGYRHRDRIRAMEKLPDLPKTDPNQGWKIMFTTGTLLALKEYFGWW